MALEAYRSKRNFAATAEPRGRTPHETNDIFVVQKHDATRLHYDFRLALDGVLKSWAVTRGPSLIPGEKRLAVAVEDHPLEYADFEGTIAQGEYGGGSVIVWDRGAWTPIGDPRKGLKKGQLDFELHGQKLKGRWHLIRMRPKPREKRENWLLIKGDDEFARPAGAADILDERPESMKTGRSIEDLVGESPGWSSKTGKIEKADRSSAAKPGARARKRAAPDPSAIEGAVKQPLPGFVEPMLATLAKSPPAGDRWLHEIKFDGYRLQARIEDGRVTLWTRRGLDWTGKFGQGVVDALRSLPLRNALIDGELAVENKSGVSEFSLLQADLSEGRHDRFVYYAFDCLYLDGYDLREAALIRRKERLEQLIGTGGVVRYSSHFEEDGGLVLQRSCALGLEGIVSKLSASAYRSGRGKSWVKCKCSARQEFVIAGYVPSSTGREAVGALALGVYDGPALRYVGRVGTGFSAATAEGLFARLEAMRIRSSPFAKPLRAAEAREVRFVRPELTAEVDFRAWTADGLLRQASFQGLREDKPAREVTGETTMPVDVASGRPQSNVKLTHPDRVYWPDVGVTKEGLADYYAEVWRFIAPLIIGRPLALVRCPDGVGGQTFFQKHAWAGLNPNIALVNDPADPSGEALITIRDFDGLIALAQSAALEIHPWGSTIADWERPDTLVMDLDPGEDVAWTSVIAAAEEVRGRLKSAGLVAFVKTSGAKGLHVVAPVKPKAEWPAAKAFAKSIADAMAADNPELYVSTIPKARRHGKILVDYLRNQRGMTAVAAYSTRARPGAPVSMPLAWNELSPGIGPAYFTIQNTPRRLASLAADPWEDFRAAAAPIEPGARKSSKRR